MNTAIVSFDGSARQYHYLTKGGTELIGKQALVHSSHKGFGVVTIREVVEGQSARATRPLLTVLDERMRDVAEGVFFNRGTF